MLKTRSFQGFYQKMNLKIKPCHGIPLHKNHGFSAVKAWITMRNNKAEKPDLCPKS